MARSTPAHTKQLMALLLLAVMVLVHIVKVLHTHPSGSHAHFSKHEHIHGQDGSIDSTCSICEFQLAKDVPFTGNQVLLLVAPVYAAPTYSRLLTALNSDHFLVTESRGPPRA